jgi:glucose/arabinose dehydrogenase
MRWAVIAAVVAVASALALPTGVAHAQAITARPVATNLKDPVAFTLAGDGRIFYGERHSGQIRVINPATGSNSLFFTFPKVFSVSESGLLGIALDPHYPRAPYVYAYATQLLGGSIWVRLLKITDVHGHGTRPRTLLAANANTTYPQHKGGRLLFSPGGMLYVYVGYQRDAANAQNLRVPFGKILRMTTNGHVPLGNPFRGSRVWSYGNRNSLGMAFDPRARRLWLTEGGPDCNDELNLVLAGRNYGWGPKSLASGTPCKTPPPPPRNTNQDGPNPTLPKLWWAATLTPTGAAFCNHCGLGRQYEGRLLVGNWKYKSHPLVAGSIRSITLNAARDGVVAQSVVFTSKKVVLSVERGPTGAVYFSDESAIYKLVAG